MIRHEPMTGPPGAVNPGRKGAIQMTLEEEIRKFIDSRKWVCSRMLQEDDGYLGALYVRAQRSLLKELEELLKNFTLQSRTATDGKEGD